MARAEDGTLVDPHGGERDLRAGILRHVSDAFAEDPVRILRVARFAARFAFAVAPDTMALMRRMVVKGEADALVPERVWQELARGLMEREPSRLLAVLRECGALARALPEIDATFDAPDVPDRLAARLDRAATRGYVLAVRYALLVLDADAAAAESLAQRVNAPAECRGLAQIAIRDRALVGEAQSLDADIRTPVRPSISRRAPACAGRPRPPARSMRARSRARIPTTCRVRSAARGSWRSRHCRNENGPPRRAVSSAAGQAYLRLAFAFDVAAFTVATFCSTDFSTVS